MKKKDIVLIIGVIIVIILGFGFNNYTNTKKSEKVEIYVNNKLYKTYDINSKEEVKIETEEGNNIIKIHDKGVEMIDASCPDKVCVHTGFISKNSESIVCLPNKVNVKIISNTNEKEEDVIAN